MKYYHYFQNETDFNNVRDNNYEEPWLSLTESVNRVDYNINEQEEQKKLLKTNTSFKIISNGTITWNANDTGYTKTIEYRKNDGEWTEITSTKGGTSISVVAGDTVQFRGNNDAYSNSIDRYNYFGGTAYFEACGNIMSLLNGNSFSGLTTISGQYAFNNLFGNCSRLLKADKLLLPATTLSRDCYYGMFFNCISLTHSPKLLPATNGTFSCYYQMFLYDNNLLTVPQILLTSLNTQCCYEMFMDCSKITTAPVLYSENLVQYCYMNMFKNCTNLNHIECLAKNISATSCTNNWLDGASTSGTFITPSTTNWSADVSGIPSGWTRVNA